MKDPSEKKQALKTLKGTVGSKKTWETIIYHNLKAINQ